MPNYGNDKTEAILKKIEEEIRLEFERAYADLERKAKKYFMGFNAEDVVLKDKVANGLMPEADYQDWRRRHIVMGQHWEDMKLNMAKELHHVNEKALRIAKDKMPDVFVLNANYAAFEIERGYGIDTGFVLFNRDAAEWLLGGPDKLLPAPGIHKALELWENPDVRWNAKNIQSAILQGILQGEPMWKVAKRLMNVTDMDYKAAVRNARTMTTAAQNAGREAAYHRIDPEGDKLTIIWLSTLDNRTRHSHRMMHGEVKDGEYFSNGLRYPGDPEGDPSEVYNCRCQERAFIKGMEEVVTYSPKMGEQSFEEWLNGKVMTKEQEQRFLRGES